jgi:hypothetical protein
MIWAAIALAVAGASCFAVAAWMQQAAVDAAAGPDGLRLKGWLRVLRAPRWISGFGLTTVGAALHACALGLAPLVVIQPVGAAAIAMTTVLAVRSAGATLTRSAGFAVAASTVGVGLFVVLAAQRPTVPVLPPGVELRTGLMTAVVVAGLGLLGAVTGGRIRCLAYAAAAGAAYGLVSVLVHAIAVDVRLGGIAAVHPAGVVGMLAALPAGMWFVQHAYASGPPPVVVACQNVVDPMLGVAVGLGLLGEADGLTRTAAMGLVGCACLAVAGVVVLTRETTARSPLGSH